MLGLLLAWDRVLWPYILVLQIAPKVAFEPLFSLVLIPEFGQAMAQEAPNAVTGLRSYV